MQALLAFFTRYFHWVVFLVLEAVSGVMLFRYNSYQGSVWLSSANAVAGKVYDWSSSVSHFFTLTRINEELTERNIFLERRVQQLMSERQTEEIEPEDFMNARQPMTDSMGHHTSQLSTLTSQLKLIPAKVVANTIDRADNLMTINRGEADGVKANMGVVCGSGLVGVVYMVSRHYAIVMPVLNSQSRISCSIRGRDYFGYLRWDGGDPLYAYVEDIPRHAKFRKGEWVETSGFSYIFPAGISVGRIVGIYNSADGLSYRLKVHLATDFACLRDVSVLDDPGMAERMMLNQAAEDSLRTEN